MTFAPTVCRVLVSKIRWFVARKYTYHWDSVAILELKLLDSGTDPASNGTYGLEIKSEAHVRLLLVGSNAHIVTVFCSISYSSIIFEEFYL